MRAGVKAIILSAKEWEARVDNLQDKKDKNHEKEHC